jgi:hypothetical protein
MMTAFSLFFFGQDLTFSDHAAIKEFCIEARAYSKKMEKHIVFAVVVTVLWPEPELLRDVGDKEWLDGM